MSSTVISFTADQIIGFKNPEKLFTGDPYTAEKEYKALKIYWHPDRSKDPKATDVFQHLSELYNEALKRLKEGVWQMEGELLLRGKKEIKPYKIVYQKQHTFELGEFYIGENHVTYLIKPEFKDLYDNAIRIIKGFKYANKKMEGEMSKYLPQILYAFDTASNHVLILKKTPDLILLRDLNEHVKGKLDPRHIAWIMSSLYNLSCYLEYAGVTNNATSLDTYFVSPEFHSGLLLGGWWYAAKSDEKLIAVPDNTLKWIPPSVLDQREGDIRIDLELIRAIGRELLVGDATKIYLVRKCGAPEALINWVTDVNLGSALKEYQIWQDVLTTSWGKRKFIKLEVTPKEVYKS